MPWQVRVFNDQKVEIAVRSPAAACVRSEQHHTPWITGAADSRDDLVQQLRIDRWERWGLSWGVRPSRRIENKSIRIPVAHAIAELCAGVSLNGALDCFGIDALKPVLMKGGAHLRRDSSRRASSGQTANNSNTHGSHSVTSSIPADPTCRGIRWGR